MKRKNLFIIGNALNMFAIGLFIGKLFPESVVPLLVILGVLVPVLILKGFRSGKRANA